LHKIHCPQIMQINADGEKKSFLSGDAFVMGGSATPSSRNSISLEKVTARQSPALPFPAVADALYRFQFAFAL